MKSLSSFNLLELPLVMLVHVYLKQSLPDGMFLPTKDSKLEDNVPKNRYTNMLACKFKSFSK